MATIRQILERFDIKAEKNATNDGISTDNLRKCLLFNEAQNKFLTLHLQNRGVDDVRYIQNFLVLDKSIPLTSSTQKKFESELPENYFDLAELRVSAEKEGCKRTLFGVEVQTENLNEYLQDEYYKPSFEWEEVLYTVNSNNVSIYTDGTFTPQKTLLDYYRYPNQLRLVNEENPESDFDETYQIEWDDKALDDIISIMVSNLDINSNNPRFQLNTLRAQK